MFARDRTVRYVERSSTQELIRQQVGIQPQGTTTEVEDYLFDLKNVTILELEIDPHEVLALAPVHTNGVSR